MRYDTIPPEFEPIAHLVSHVVKRTATEWSGSCPQCGGQTHQNGEPSDRFRMWTVSKIGKPLGWCRRCSYTWFPDKGREPSDEEKEAWRQEQIRIETERKRSAERAIELLRDEHIWDLFHSYNNQDAYDIYEKRGLSKDWVDYYKFGLNTKYEVWTKPSDGWESYYSPALTIPVWTVGNLVKEVKLRVLNPKYDGDRYRAWYKTRITSLFHPLHDMSIEKKALVVEGEFKAATVRAHVDDLSLSVVGIQSKRPDPKVFQDIANCETVFLGLDPDAFEADQGESAVDYCVKEIGKERCAIVEFGCKPDDGIVQDGLDVMRYVRMARKA